MFRANPFSVLFRSASTAARTTIKPLESRKTFLVDQYKNLMETNQVVLFLHHNNLQKAETANFRNQIQDVGGKLTVLRNNLFKVYLRSENHADPATVAASYEGKQYLKKHPLAPLFKGPTAAVTFKETEPAKVAKLLKLLEKSQDKLFVIGAKVEGSVYDLPQIQQFKTLPSKLELQSQLAGLLTVLSGAGLVHTLEAGAKVLYLTLDSHKKNMEPKE